ncbi:MerR family transcriptional regulator [Luteipulveratus mongoliensis]|uniref:HTH merR-type domain-containing protein n=1 Tax=Luteipulveratus mongoliensis TaxID=571913 RepID=A0A0K1JID1_9MICO|nr:MerR family transcriptional regulator [Luteipulveratus mongoliensis]AKU16340.1 hypothetical protein VV02_11500 [Luteipulveratus mongoliensis]
MRMSELSARTDVPIATLKFYLREGVLHAGEPLNRTQARYDDSHVERVRLVRALTDSGGLSMAGALSVIETLEHPPPLRHDLLGAAQHALTGEAGESASPEAQQRVSRWLEQRGWQVPPTDPLLGRLAEQLDAAASAGIEVPDERLDRYADGMEIVAGADVDSVPTEDADALRYVVVATVMVDPVLLTLRRLAQQDRSARSGPGGGV